MSDEFGDIPFSKIFSQYDPLEAGDIGDVDLFGQNIGSLYPDVTSNISIPDLENLLADTDLFAAFAKFDPESAALLSGGNLTKTGTLALTGEGIIADAAQDAIAEELGQDATKIGSLTQDSADSALVNPADINKNVKVTQAPISEKVKKTIADVLGLDDKTISDLGKYGLLAGIAKLAYDDAEKARQRARGWIAPGGAAKRSIVGPKGHIGYTKAARGGVMSLAGGGSIFNEKGPEDYALDRGIFMEANTPAGEATQYDIYGNMIMPDPYMRSMTEGETNQIERDAAREYYNNPENVAAENQIAQQLRDAVFVPGGQAGTIDVQETLRNIRQNAPEEFAEFINQLQIAPSEAKEFVDYRLGEAPLRTAEGFGNDNIPYNPDIVFPLADVANSPNINRLVGDLLNLSDPNTSRTFFEGYNPSNYNEGFIRGGSGGGGFNKDVNYEMSAYAAGGIASLNQKQPFYLGGSTDGMTDEVPAHIDGKRPAALSDGEFVIPADVVSHLGNGNSNAGAQRLYEMMDQVRQARTGTAKQGKQINPEDFTKGVASFAGGGEVMDFRKLTPEQARQAWVEYGRTGEDPYGLAFDMMVGGKAANSLVNTGVNQLVNKNKQLRAADPTGYDVGNIVSNIVHKDFNKSQGTSSSLLPAHQQLQSYQKGTGLTDQQMINAMSKSPLRSGSTYLQNLNLLLGPDYSNLLKP